MLLVGGAASAVLARYDELAALVAESVEPDPDRWQPAAPADLQAATRAVHGEARQLDTRRFDAWLEGWTDDAVLWVPLGEAAHPATDQSLFLDDRRRLGDRVRWRGERSAWAQHPPSMTVRTVGTIDAWTPIGVSTTRRVLVRSAIVIVEQRVDSVEVLAGHQVHELVGDELRRRTKVLLVPQLSIGVSNPSFLL